MGILDEAIREHLELKRQHGADDSELKQIEAQAFGPAERPGSEESAPDAAAEAPTQFMAQPATETETPAEDASAEAPEPAPPARREPAAGMTDIQEPPEPVEEEPAAEQPSEEEQPAGEHAVPGAPAGPSTEERHAIADQPTEMYDVEEEFAPASSGETSDDELIAEEIVEPRLGPADPVAIPGADEEEGEEEEEEEEDFFDEKRLSDELDQALEAPVEPARESEPESEEIETGPEEEDGPEDENIDEDEHDEDENDEDLLEETPDFLEEAPEDDQLWFEQKPPKDFDFDD